MKRLLIISFVLLLSGIVFAGPPAIPPKDLIEVSDNCNQPQYYVLGKVCQSSVDGKLYKGDGNQIIELAAGTSEGDMLGAFYASEGRIRPLRGGTGIDSSGLSGFPRVTSGTWSVLSAASLKSALGFLTSTDYPVTGVASPTAGMIPKWGVSGNTLVDGYDVADFQMVYPSAGIPVSTGEGWGSPVTYSNITGLWASGACSGYLKSDGSCDTPSGGSGYTNLTSFVDQTAWRLFYSDGSGGVKELAFGTDGQYLRSNGASAIPSWGTPTGGGSGFDVAGNYTPTGVWNWSTVGAGTTWPTFNQSTTGNAATATTATTATNLSNYSVLYNGSMTDGHIVSYRSADGKLQDAGSAVAYTQPATNLPLCRTGAGAVGACTYLTDAAAGGFDVTGSYSPTGTWNWSGVNAATTWPTFNQNTIGTAAGLTNYSVLYNGTVTDGNILAYNAADGKLRNAGFSYIQPGTNLPLCRTGSGTIGACSNLTDTDMSSIEGSADDIGVKIETISTDPEEVIECEGKDRNYIVGFNEPSFFQLPADPTGVRYCFGNNDYAKVISIVPDGTDTITHGGTATTSGQGLVSTGSAQDWVCLLGLSSSKWRTISYLGTWTIDEVELPSEPEEPEPGDCTTPTGNVVTESFGEGSTLCWTSGDSVCDNTWTRPFGRDGYPEIAAVPVGAPSNTACTSGVLSDTSSLESSIWSYYSLGANAPASNVEAVINLTAYVESSALDGYQGSTFFNFTSETAITSPNGYTYLRLRNAGGGGTEANRFQANGTTACEIPMTLETWYNLTITLDAAGAENGSTLSDGTNSCSFTRGTYVGTQNLLVGAQPGQKVYVGNLRVSTTGWE